MHTIDRTHFTDAPARVLKRAGREMTRRTRRKIRRDSVNRKRAFLLG